MFSPRNMSFGFVLGRIVRMTVVRSGVCDLFVVPLMYSAICS